MSDTHLSPDEKSSITTMTEDIGNLCFKLRKGLADITIMKDDMHRLFAEMQTYTQTLKQEVDAAKQVASTAKSDIQTMIEASYDDFAQKIVEGQRKVAHKVVTTSDKVGEIAVEKWQSISNTIDQQQFKINQEQDKLNIRINEAIGSLNQSFSIFKLNVRLRWLSQWIMSFFFAAAGIAVGGFYLEGHYLEATLSLFLLTMIGFLIYTIILDTTNQDIPLKRVIILAVVLALISLIMSKIGFIWQWL